MERDRYTSGRPTEQWNPYDQPVRPMNPSGPDTNPTRPLGGNGAYVRNQHDRHKTHSRPNESYGRANEYSQSEIDRYLERWNWGAFLASWFWAPFNGIFWPLFILLLWWIPYLGQVLQICLMVYLGLNGSRMAWRRGPYRDFGTFRKSQNIWAIIGIVILGGIVVANVFTLKSTLLMF